MRIPLEANTQGLIYTYKPCPQSNDAGLCADEFPLALKSNLSQCDYGYLGTITKEYYPDNLSKTPNPENDWNPVLTTVKDENGHTIKTYQKAYSGYNIVHFIDATYRCKQADNSDFPSQAIQLEVVKAVKAMQPL
jgi:hypothetical protein